MAKRLRLIFIFSASILAILAGGSPGPAAAAPGALRILIDESQCDAEEHASRLGQQILANPGVAAVDFVNGAQGTPSAAELEPYDVVVAIGDCTWLDAKATGNALAAYQDAGGVVVGVTFDWQEVEGGYTLEGRWIEGGYSPYEIGAPSVFGLESLGAENAGSPLLTGVGPLSAYYRDEVELEPGATELAEWADGTSAIALKGHALAINGYLGPNYAEPGEAEPGEMVWNGNYGRLIVNAGNFFHPAPPPAPTAPLSPAPAPPPLPCRVPNLKGKTVKAARKALQAAHCRLGKVSRPKGVGSRRVKTQSPQPGVERAAETAVNVRLKPIVPKHQK